MERFFSIRFYFQALGGTLSAVAMIAALAGGDNARVSAFGYFISATVATILALVAYFSLYYLVSGVADLDDSALKRTVSIAGVERGKVCQLSDDKLGSLYVILTHRKFQLQGKCINFSDSESVVSSLSHLQGTG